MHRSDACHEHTQSYGRPVPRSTFQSTSITLTFRTFSLTINADNGTDPVADGATDTLSFVSGAGVTVTGDGTTDTLTIAATLGATIDNSSEIVDGTIANADLAYSSVTVTAGNGLTTGGAVSLGVRSLLILVQVLVSQ